MQHSSSHTHHSAPSQLPFRLKPLSFDLSTPSSLTSLSTPELALAWIAPHPDWKDHLHWVPMVAEWKRRRAVAFKAGAQPVKEVKSETDIELQSLAWSIPQDLEEVDSVRLATLPLHPYFDPSLAQRARSIFQSRRVEGLSATSEQRPKVGTPPLTPPPSLSPPPTEPPRSVLANPFALVPLEVTCTWEVVLIHAIDGSYSLEQVRAIVSPPALPQPVAVKLVSKPTGLADLNICFLAYADPRDAAIALIGLKTVVCPAGSRVRQLETARSTARGGEWEWYTTSEHFRRRYAERGGRSKDHSRFDAFGQTVRPPSQVPEHPPTALDVLDHTDGMRTSFSRPSSPPIALLPSFTHPTDLTDFPSHASTSEPPPSGHSASSVTPAALSTREQELREALLARKRSREQHREKEKAESFTSSLPHKSTSHYSSAVPTGPRNRQIPTAQPPTAPRAMLASIPASLPFARPAIRPLRPALPSTTVPTHPSLPTRPLPAQPPSLLSSPPRRPAFPPNNHGFDFAPPRSDQGWIGRGSTRKLEGKRGRSSRQCSWWRSRRVRCE